MKKVYEGASQLYVSGFGGKCDLGGNSLITDSLSELPSEHFCGLRFWLLEYSSVNEVM